MATKENDGNGSLRKDKKATRSSNSNATTRKHSNPKPAATSESSGKPLPNYLRPTLSSRSESFKSVKKTTNNEDSTQKLLRRRSFDRPPSTLPAQKSLPTPAPKERSVPSRDTTLVSNRPSPSNSASRIQAIYKPVFERNSKSLKPARPQQQQPPATSRTIRKSRSVSKDSYTSKSRSSTPPQNVNSETNQETSNESLVQEIEETVNVEGDEVQRARNHENMNVVEDSQVKNDNFENEKIKTSDNITGLEDAQSVCVSHDDQVNESELHELDLDDNTYEEDHQQEKEESYENQLPEKVVVDDTKDKGNEDKEVNYENTCNISEDALVEEAAKNEGSEELKSKKDDEEATESVEEGNSGKGINAMQKNQKKKESPTAYNDVIEETKNKLLEKRKNKVKALVGAFETVIDYETAAGANN